MKIELSEQDLKLIRTSLGKFYAELCEEKKKLKGMISSKSNGKKNLFYDVIDPSGRIKEINQKLEEILKLENRVFIKNNAPVKKGV